MNPALWISKTGLDAQQTNISVTSNNLANASTVGYKKARAIFEDLLYQNVNQPGGRSSADTELPSGLMLGAGAKVVATQKNHSQGNVQTTDNSLDLMISGRGYFEIQLPDGSAAYTRNGQFTLNDEGTIVTPGNERSVALLGKLGLVRSRLVRLSEDADECLLLEAADTQACTV